VLRYCILFVNKLSIRVKRSLVDIKILEVLIRGRIRYSIVVENLGPVSFEVEVGNPAFMRNEKITFWV
jgi:predicted membrane GTPase involved in stress response